MGLGEMERRALWIARVGSKYVTLELRLARVNMDSFFGLD